MITFSLFMATAFFWSTIITGIIGLIGSGILSLIGGVLSSIMPVIIVVGLIIVAAPFVLGGLGIYYLWHEQIDAFIATALDWLYNLFGNGSEEVIEGVTNLFR